MTSRKPGVLMVVGAYYPELSGAGLQCRTLVRALRDRVHFVVLTTTADRSLPVTDLQDGVTVHRVFVDPSRWWSKVLAAFIVTRIFIRTARQYSIVHLHGFSQKSILIVWLASVGGKKIAIKLTSFGHDDLESIAGRGRLAAWCYSKAAMLIAVSPRFFQAGGHVDRLARRMKLIPNGVDLVRFHPPEPGERDALRRALSMPPGAPVVLFVGFFSQEKRPHLLFDAWVAARLAAPDSLLVFVGATRSTYYEVDQQLAGEIRVKAETLGLASSVRFVEETREVELFHRAADVFVLPSVREGLPNVLLEAMASGAACVATRLEGVTDAILEDQRTGLLVPVDDQAALQGALRRLFEDRALREELGREARRTIEARYSLEAVSDQYLGAYEELLNAPVCVA